MATPLVASDKPAVKSGRRPPLLVGLVLLAVAFAGYVGWQHFAHVPTATPGPPPPVPVIATTVKQQNFPIVLTGIGNVAALNSATVRSMVTEPIISIDFKDGQSVKKSQLLAQLDPSTYHVEFAGVRSGFLFPRTCVVPLEVSELMKRPTLFGWSTPVHSLAKLHMPIPKAN